MLCIPISMDKIDKQVVITKAFIVRSCIKKVEVAHGRMLDNRA